MKTKGQWKKTLSFNIHSNTQESTQNRNKKSKTNNLKT